LGVKQRLSVAGSIPYGPTRIAQGFSRARFSAHR
jgi:hypothetical protein